jgi:hypothetical protein
MVGSDVSLGKMQAWHGARDEMGGVPVEFSTDIAPIVFNFNLGFHAI